MERGLDSSLWLLCLYVLDDAGGIAGGDGVGGNGVGDDRTGTDGTVIADGDAGQDGDVAAYPDIVTDCDRFCPFLARGTFDRVGAMTGGVYMYARADETIITDGDKCFV